MTEVDASKLPYPWPEGMAPISTTGPLSSLEPVRFPGALAAGKTLVTSPRTDVKEGVLAFYQDFLTLFLDDGRKWSVSYESLASYRLKRGVIHRKLTLRSKDGANSVLAVPLED